MASSANCELGSNPVNNVSKGAGNAALDKPNFQGLRRLGLDARKKRLALGGQGSGIVKLMSGEAASKRAV